MFGTPSICLDAPYMFRCPHMFGFPHIFRHPHIFGCPICLVPSIYLDVPLYVWMPPYVWTPPISLDALHMPECPTHICMPPCSPVYLHVSRGYLHMIWGMGASVHSILNAQMLLQGEYTKSIISLYILEKHKYLNKTPYDL